MPPDRLIVFARRPVAGRVKRRLSPPLPPDEAAAVYEASLRDVVARSARERARVELWFDAGRAPRQAERYFAQHFPAVTAVRQSGGDAGARVVDAFARAFAQGAERAVLVSGDAPTVPEAFLHAAFDHLGPDGADVVLGPAVAGGYYLIGLRREAWPAAATLLHELPRSNERLLPLTAERSARLGLELRLLPGWYDIERPEDLARARADVEPNSHLGRWLDGRQGEHYIPRA